MNLETIKQLDSKQFGFIGERLKKIRLELIELDSTKDKRFSPFSLTNISETLNMDRTAMANVERGASISNSLKVIIYYYTLGYNPLWIIIPENDFITMRNLGENMVYKKEIQSSYMELDNSIKTALEVFKSNL